MLRQIGLVARRQTISPAAAQRWVGATSALACAAAGIGATRKLAHNESPKGAKVDNDEKESKAFDIASYKDGIAKILKDSKILSDDAPQGAKEVPETKPPTKEEVGFFDMIRDVFDGDQSTSQEKKSKSSDGFAALARTVVSLVSGKDDSKEEAVRALIDKAHNNVDAGDVNEQQSYGDILSMFQDLQSSLVKTFTGVDFSKFDPTSLFYYLEYEDERKNPSWKRMMHRYHRGVDVRKVNDLNDALYLAHLAYANTADEVKDGLDHARDKWELIYFEPNSTPGKPSHFLALKKGQSRWSSSLEVAFVVRGTKSVPDMITDALMVPEDYRGGKAHDGVVRSGRYLVKKHEKLLEDLKRTSGKSKVKLRLVGHSLGAAAASVAGMEFNDREGYDATVVGFGCPALLSRELSEGARGYITTVINDADMVPRTSGATLANIALNLMEYDWTPKARRDAEQALDELRSAMPLLIGEEDVRTAMGFVDSIIASYIKPGIKDRTEARMGTVLYPPGTCIHFYRDGSGISGAYAPCTFFRDIDFSRTMIDDHLINKGYKRLFLELMRDYHDDAYYKFDTGKDLDF